MTTVLPTNYSHLVIGLYSTGIIAQFLLLLTDICSKEWITG